MTFASIKENKLRVFLQVTGLESDYVTMCQKTAGQLLNSCQKHGKDLEMAYRMEATSTLPVLMQDMTKLLIDVLTEEEIDVLTATALDPVLKSATLKLQELEPKMNSLIGSTNSAMVAAALIQSGHSGSASHKH